MRKPFSGNYPITPGRHFGAPMIANDTKYGSHKGVDWALPPGTALYACVSGTVTYASNAQDAGLTVTIKNGNNLYKCFHMSKINVVVGQQVKEGDYIGTSGATGNTTGPHLHFQVEKPAGNPVDPLPLIGNVLGEVKGADEVTKTNKNAARIMARFIGGRLGALSGENDDELERLHVGRDLERELLDWYNSDDGKRFDAYQKQAFAFYEKYKHTDFTQTANPKANKLFEALREAVKE